MFDFVERTSVPHIITGLERFKLVLLKRIGEQPKVTFGDITQISKEEMEREINKREKEIEK